MYVNCGISATNGVFATTREHLISGILSCFKEGDNVGMSEQPDLEKGRLPGVDGIDQVRLHFENLDDHIIFGP